MADKHARRTQHDLEVSGPERVRNVVLVGPAQSGKTTLLEALAEASGAITRAGSVADGSTLSDHDEAEHAHQRSVSLSVVPLVHAGVKVNLVDTPGYADFVGEVRAGLRAADCALFVVAANDNIDDATRALWHECDEVGMPRVVVVTKLDHARADLDWMVSQARSTFGDRVVPAFVLDGDALTPLLTGEDARRGDLIEGVIEESEDEELMDRYLEGEDVPEEVLLADLEKAVARATFFPVVPVCAQTRTGCRELLDLMVRAFPSPPEHRPPEAFTSAGAEAGEVACDPDGPLVAEVVKTTSDPYVGRVSLVRVFSGALDADLPVHVSGHFSSFFGEGAGHEDHDEDERIGTLGHPFGAAQVPARRVLAGDIGMIGRLSRAETGDTLSSVDAPRVLRPWTMPEPMLPVAIEAATKSDEDKLSQALGRLAAEEPSLLVQLHPETRQVLLWVMGEAHAEVALERLSGRYGVAVEQRDVRVPLRETFAGPSKGHGRHVKQSGGHGQFAICDLEVEPLPEGTGFEFVDKVVGGAVPKQFIPSVEKGVRTQMERGIRLGYPLVDIRVTLTGGKAHSVDSSDMAFQTAGALALREAAEAGQVTMLEPYDEVSVSATDSLVGTLMSDISARRGRLLGTEQAADGQVVVRAVVPQLELVRYAVDLRSMTHGAGSFTRSFAHYEAMPEDLAREMAPHDA